MNDEINTIDDGGPAFPSTCDFTFNGVTTRGHAGMSLRAWLAGKALAGWLAALPAEAGANPTYAAKVAVDHADALIAELKRKPRP